jgi:uncharacterized membrane protein
LNTSPFGGERDQGVLFHHISTFNFIWYTGDILFVGPIEKKKMIGVLVSTTLLFLAFSLAYWIIALLVTHQVREAGPPSNVDGSMLTFLEVGAYINIVLMGLIIVRAYYERGWRK